MIHTDDTASCQNLKGLSYIQSFWQGPYRPHTVLIYNIVINIDTYIYLTPLDMFMIKGLPQYRTLPQALLIAGLPTEEATPFWLRHIWSAIIKEIPIYHISSYFNSS